MDAEILQAITPGGKFVKARVLDKEWDVKQSNWGNVMSVPLFDKTGLKVLAKCITERIDHKRDCPVLVTGDCGAGKSTVIAEGGLQIDPKLPVSNVAFRLEEFEQIFDKNPIGDGSKHIYPQVIMDEAGYAMYGAEWLKQEQRILAKQLIISRIKQQIIWMAVPKRKQLNNQVRDMAFIWIHVLEPKEYFQGYAIVRFAPPELQSEWLPEKYWLPKFAFTFPSLFGPWWEEYEQKKIAFVNEVTAETAKGKQKSSKRIEAGDKAIKELYVKDGYSERTLADHLGISDSTIHSILNETDS